MSTLHQIDTYWLIYLKSCCQRSSLGSYIEIHTMVDNSKTHFLLISAKCGLIKPNNSSDLFPDYIIVNKQQYLVSVKVIWNDT